MIKKYAVTVDGVVYAIFDTEQDAKDYVDLMDDKVRRGPICYDAVPYFPGRCNAVREYVGDADTRKRLGVA